MLSTAGAALFIGVAGIPPNEDIFPMPTMTKARMVTGVDAQSNVITEKLARSKQIYHLRKDQLTGTRPLSSPSFIHKQQLIIYRSNTWSDRT